MEEFEGSRAGTRVYMCPKKFLYRIDRGAPGDDVLYYKCTLKRCTGRAISYQGVISYRSKHSHGPQLAQAEAHRFRAELRRRAAQETGHLETIYMQTQVLYREAAVQDGCGFEQVRFSMLRARNADRPSAPDTLISAAISIQDPKFFDQYGFSLGPGKRNLYHGMVSAADGKKSMILKSADVIDFIQMHIQENNPLHLYVDTSYDIATLSGGCKHFMTINLEYRGHGFPIMFAFMEAKNVATYVSVFKEVTNILRNVTYSSISVAQDDDLKQAIKDTHPNVTICNSWFYYSAAIYKQAELLRLTESDNKELRQLIKMTACLPLLPNELSIRNGWTLLCNHLNRHKNENIIHFSLYMESVWLSKDVFQFKRLSQYSDTTFKNSLRRILGKQRISFWTLYKNIQLIEHSYGLKLIRVFNNRELVLLQKKGCQEFKKHLDFSLRTLSEDRDIARFLKLTSSKLNLVMWLVRKYADNRENSGSGQYSDTDSDLTELDDVVPKKQIKRKIQNKTKHNRRVAVSAFVMDHNYIKQSLR